MLMKSNVVKFPRKRKAPKNAGGNVTPAQIIEFPQHARPTLTQRIRMEPCPF